MFKNNNLTETVDVLFKLDRNNKKSYNEKNKYLTGINTQNTTTTAQTPLYPYGIGDQTQNFLKNNSSFSASIRNEVQTEQKQLSDIAKQQADDSSSLSLQDSTNDNTSLRSVTAKSPSNHAYQLQLAKEEDAAAKLQDAFHASQLRNGLHSNASTKNILEVIDYTLEDFPIATNQDQHIVSLKTNNKYEVPPYSNNQTISFSTNSFEYDNAIKENAKMNNKSVATVRKSSDIIKKNAIEIKNAGSKYGVNPSIIAACIYSEQMLNYNATDLVRDKMYWDNPTVGIGQVSIETAKTIENKTNIEKTKYLGKKYDWHGNNYIEKDAWYIPGYGTFLGTYEQALSKRLSIDAQCVEYVAAYLKIIQDLWREKYPIIDGKTDILATLYNIGEYGGKKGINANPEPNPFGSFAKANYYYMQYLLGL